MASLVLLFSELLHPDDAYLHAADCSRTHTCPPRRDHKRADAEKKLKKDEKMEVLDLFEDPLYHAKFSVDSIWP